MFELAGALQSPDRRSVTLREIAGSRGLAVVGVGAAANADSRWFTGSMSGETMSDNEVSNASTISASAMWALERLAEIRYGREAPAIGWSVTRELISAGFVSCPMNGRLSISITPAGRTFLKSRK